MTTEGLGSPKGGIPELTWAADKNAGCCKAMNWAAMGFRPGGPPGGPKPLPKGFLSNRGSEKKTIALYNLGFNDVPYNNSITLVQL